MNGGVLCGGVGEITVILQDLEVVHSYTNNLGVKIRQGGGGNEGDVEDT